MGRFLAFVNRWACKHGWHPYSDPFWKIVHNGKPILIKRCHACGQLEAGGTR